MSVSLYGSGQTVIQVAQQVYTASSSTTSNSLVDTGLTLSITPQSTTSKILILVNLNIGGGIGYTTGFQLNRAGSAIGTGTIGSSANQTAGAGTASNGGFMTVGISYLDSPSTTSATTYKVQWRTQAGSPTAYINQTQYLSGGADTYQAGTISTITLLEISGS